MSDRRLVLVTRRFWPLVGGAERAMENLAAELAVRGEAVELFTARWSRQWPADLMHRGIRVHRIGQSRRRFLGTWQYVRGLQRAIARGADQTRLLYVSMLKHDAYAAIGAAAAQRIPVVLRAEGAGLTGDVHWQLSALGGRWIKQRCLRAAALVAPSEAIRQELVAAGFPRDRIHYIPNGVALPAERTEQGQAAARQALAASHPDLRLPSGARLAVYTGRLDPRKGLDDLVRAWSLVDASDPQARLWLVGEGPAAVALREQIAAQGLSGRVVLAGNFDHVDDALAAADLFVLPSYEEGMSLALLEAMAAPLPVVASDIAGNRPLVDHERQGLVVPPGQIEAWAGAIKRVFSQTELARAWADQARRRVQQQYSLDLWVDRHQQLFDRLTAAAGR